METFIQLAYTAGDILAQLAIIAVGAGMVYGTRRALRYLGRH